MTDKVFEQIYAIKNTGLVNMFAIQDVFELALKKNYDELCNFIFERTDCYTKLF